MQLLPEAVLVLTALVLLGAAVAVETQSGKPISKHAAIVIAACGVVLAGLALCYVPVDVDSGKSLSVIDPLAHIF